MQDFYTLDDLRNWDAQKSAVRLGVFGDPVAHSLSPAMQNAALETAGIEARYGAFHIRGAELEEALRLLAARHFIGVNLTLPHKVAAARIVDQLEGFAREVGAVNTIRIEDDKLIGFNTDGPGFARAIRHEFSVDLRDLRVLLLGAGGGGQAIAQQCAREGCERLVVANRTFDEARRVVETLRPYFQDTRVLGPVARLEAVPSEEQALRFQIANVDLVVNATPLGMKRSDPPVLTESMIAPHLMIYDTVYAPARTPLLQAAAEAGARGANGLSMLLYQGALAFETWFDREAPVEAMRAALLSANA